MIPPPTNFKPERDIPDLSGQIALITGGNAGLGYQTAKQLLLKGAKVYIAAHSPEKATEAIKRLRTETSATEDQVHFVKLDLADLRSVRAGAADFLAREERLDILFNNGGCMTTPVEQLTVQNFNLQFGTNIPALRSSHVARGLPARVINLSSWAHNLAPAPTGFVLDTLRDGEMRNKQTKKWGMLAPWRLYGQSKLGNLLISNYFAREYSDILVSCAVHPGFISTDLGQHQGVMGLSFRMFYTASMGAQTQLWAGTAAPAAQINGKYLIPWARIAEPGVANQMSQSLETESMLVVWMKRELNGF
ncbi:NAD(P)-binding protein [Mycena venus]|uniref:NAD(P)-binding protein n=1 Tax=Mycena venus TaxID=2733690 RepID=A0A8H6Y165_9AGAR|nr:NAD(P)-binding protein [Mycena venus]